MGLYAVINGDIIGSTKMTAAERDAFLGYLRKGFDTVKKQKSLGVVKSFEMYRGDSFQAAIHKPEKALRVVLLLRSMSRMHQPAKARVNTRAKKNSLPSSLDVMDLRIAVGIGTITKLSTKLMESDGGAFHRSGRLFDSMRSGVNMAIDTSSNTLNKELDAAWALMDTIVNKWTARQAEVAYYSLLGHNQIQIAGKYLKTSPSAVNQRLKGAGWPALKKMILYFEGTVPDKFR